MIERSQTLREEIANSIIHGIFLLAAIICSPFLISKSFHANNNFTVLTAVVFAIAVIFVYFVSTLYHAMPKNRAKNILRTVDYGAVCLLIAGTYTPIALNVIKGGWGWVLFGVEWTLALTGIIFLYYRGIENKKFLLFLYLIMGWLVIIAIKQLWIELPIWGIFWIFAGGFAYTLGVPFYRLSHLNFRHFIWHIFVAAGTACHSVAVFYYAI